MGSSPVSLKKTERRRLSKYLRRFFLITVIVYYFATAVEFDFEPPPCISRNSCRAFVLTGVT